MLSRTTDCNWIMPDLARNIESAAYLVTKYVREGLALEEVCGDQLHRPQLGSFQVLSKFVEITACKERLVLMFGPSPALPNNCISVFFRLKLIVRAHSILLPVFL